MNRSIKAVAVVAALTTAALAQQVEPVEYELPNGMTFLLLPRDEQPNNISAGWVTRVGSVNEVPGGTGIAHFLEHMLFKGSDTIGTNNAKADREIRDQLRAVRQQMREIQITEQYRRFFDGEIDNPWDPANDTDQLRELREQLTALVDTEKEFIENNEFDRIYTTQGGSGMNAGTGQDQTLYFINIPSNKLELWAWMESERLGNGILREFDAEREVVLEERRQTLEATPTGNLDQAFDAMFWQSSPYSWPIIGWRSDMRSWTEQQVRDFFDTYYQPSNITGVIAGDFDVDEAKRLIDLYFSRLSDPGRGVPPMLTFEIERIAEMRMTGECDCQPQTAVRYLTVPFGHKDSAALDVLADILNGRTGRLYKSLIEDKGIAASARAYQRSMKYAGYFEFNASTKGAGTPEQLEADWYDVLADLQDNPVGQRELQKIKNRNAANAYRRLQSNQALMFQLGQYSSMDDWRYINRRTGLINAVTADDVMRVANEYFDASNRCVGLYYRKEGTAQIEITLEDAIAALPEAQREMMRANIEAQAAQLASETDVEKLKQTLEQIEGGAAQAPPAFATMMKFMTQEIAKRIAELESAGGEQQ